MPDQIQQPVLRRVSAEAWETLYAAEYDLRFALAHQEVGPSLGLTVYTDKDIETLRRRVADARAAVTTPEGITTETTSYFVDWQRTSGEWVEGTAPAFASIEDAVREFDMDKPDRVTHHRVAKVTTTTTVTRTIVRSTLEVTDA